MSCSILSRIAVTITVKPGWFLFHSVFEHLSDHFFGTFLRNSVVIEFNLHLFPFVFFLVNSFFLIILASFLSLASLTTWPQSRDYGYLSLYVIKFIVF